MRYLRTVPNDHDEYKHNTIRPAMLVARSRGGSRIAGTLLKTKSALLPTGDANYASGGSQLSPIETLDPPLYFK